MESSCPAIISKWIKIDSLKDKNKRVRKKADEALGKIGSKAEKAAKSAIGALVSALRDQDEDVREAARAALEKIQQK